jgi:hypothetical protein
VPVQITLCLEEKCQKEINAHHEYRFFNAIRGKK